MRLHIISDVHLEFGRWLHQYDINALDADVSVLAGDIGVGLAGIDFALSIQRPVIYVMGNHEYYGQRTMARLWEKAQQKVAGSHVHLLNNASVEIGGVRFLGATLWTDFALHGEGQQAEMMAYARSNINDYRNIFMSRRSTAKSSDYFSSTREKGGDRLTPAKVLSMHQESRAFLEGGLRDNAGRKTVVVTHHAPSALSLEYNEGDYTDASYASNLDALVGMANLWVHGHTHHRVDYRVGQGRVISNPRGYVGEELVREFEPLLVVEV